MAERGPYAKGEARRAEIVAAATKLIAENGYRSTSLRGIGRELGLSPAHLLHYFSSKEALLEEVIRAWDSRSPAIWLDAGAATADDDRYLGRWVRVVRDNMATPGLVHLYTAFAAEAAEAGHPSRSFFQERFRRLRSYVANAVVDGQRAGRFAESLDPDSAAVRLIALSDGLQLLWLVDPAVDMADELQKAIDRLG